MGNTTSNANISTTNSQLFMNVDDIKVKSEQINKQISNTVVSNAKSCSADINNNQAITIKGFTTKGDFNFTANQEQAAALTFSCVQASTVRNSAGSEIISNMMNTLQNTVSNEALSQLDAAAKNNASSSFGAIGNTQTNTNVNTINNYKSVTENHKDIENVLKNVVQNNFTSENVSHCISQVNNNQQVNLQEVNVGGKAVIAIDQSQAANTMSECVQNDNVGNKILNAAIGAMGIKVQDKSTSASVMQTKSEVVAEAHMAGYLEGISGLLSSVFGGLQGIISSPGGIMISVVLCVVIMVVLWVINNNPDLVTGMMPV